MEVDEIQTPQQPCKFSRVNSNGTKLATHQDNNTEETTTTTTTTTIATASATPTTAPPCPALNGGDVVGSSNITRLRNHHQWQHSTRIIRVSRASGGKDRHSKVWTSKGPRDRRVRLSVTTAIQFYDLQDRLGFDQPSKAVEWLIKAAAEAINELPSLNANFPPETPRQLSDERRGGDSNEVEMDNNGQQVQMGGSMSKSGCSSNNSETSKGSGGLSLSRTESRVKARERARERTAKEKERDCDTPHSENNNSAAAAVVTVASGSGSTSARVSAVNNISHHHMSSMAAQTSSFTQLLTAGINNLNHESNKGGSSSSPKMNNNNHNSLHQWLSSASNSTTAMDYFGSTAGQMMSTSRAGQGQMGLGNASLMTILPFSDYQHHQQHFPFVSEQHSHHHHHHLMGNAGGSSGGGGGGSGNSSDHYNLNFSISPSSTTTSSGLGAAAGLISNRGTLQSNSPSPPPPTSSLLPYLQHRFSSPTDGSSLPFFLGGATVENNHNHNHHQQQQFQHSGLQLCYGDGGGRQAPDQKGKPKN